MATTRRARAPDLRTFNGIGDEDADGPVRELMRRAGGSVQQAAELERLLF